MTKRFTVELTEAETRVLINGAARIEAEYGDGDVTWHEAQAAGRAMTKLWAALGQKKDPRARPDTVSP